MAERLRWWVIPGALVVLARVVTLDGAVPTPASPVEPTALPEQVLVRDATGHREGLLALAAAGGRAFVLEVPGHLGERGQLTLWRRIGGERELAPWLTLRPAVRADGTIPIAGLTAGCYDVDLQFGEGADREQLHAKAVTVPGRLLLAEPCPGR